MLLLDEFPLFHSDVIDALRQPLENGEITIARGEESATYPARGIVVMACNPCACGEYDGSTNARCECTEQARRAYRRKITGPVQDRIDIVRHVAPMTVTHRAVPGEPVEDSAVVRARVAAARGRQRDRFRGRGWRLNAQVPGAALLAEWPLPASARLELDKALCTGLLSRRGAVRVHRLAWTVADLRGADAPADSDVETALRLRLGKPLLGESVRRAG